MRKLWLAGALVLFLPAVGTWARFLREHRLAKPKTPIDIAQPIYAEYWRFLASARRVVPNGSSYTVKGQTLAEEMELFELSLDLFTGVDAKPSSYLSIELAGGGQDARYVLVHGSGQCPADATIMRPVEGGSVCIRE